MRIVTLQAVQSGLRVHSLVPKLRIKFLPTREMAITANFNQRVSVNLPRVHDLTPIHGFLMSASGAMARLAAPSSFAVRVLLPGTFFSAMAGKALITPDKNRSGISRNRKGQKEEKYNDFYQFSRHNKPAKAKTTTLSSFNLPLFFAQLVVF